MVEKSRFKKTKYEIVKFEDEYEFITGDALLLDGKICHVNIHEDCIGNKVDLKKVQDFLNEVEKMEWMRETDSMIG